MKKEEKEIAIEIKNLTKEYKMYPTKKDRLIEAVFPGAQRHGTFRAMDNLNLEVKKGEILGILGKNGAGKSTLLKMVTGVVTPTSGEIITKGKISSLLELGTAFNMELTGIENIYQHGQVMGLTNEQIEERKQEIIDFADIGEHLYQPVKTYSSGMFARLAFSCAINVDPEILIVDEVLSVGDMAFQLKCFKKFDQFKKAGKTILFVTHSITDVLKNCTRTIIINSGKKIFDGGVKEGVEKYKKIIVGLDESLQPEKEEKKKISIEGDFKKEKAKNTWKSHFNQNNNIIEYGNGQADVIDYGIFDENGKYLQSIDNAKDVILKSKIKFNADVNEPIFTMTLKDFNGLEVCGTNTLIEKIATGKFKKGDIVETFGPNTELTTRLRVAPNKYTLSFSCTHFKPNGELEVLSRKYDALLVEIISSKEHVGILSLDTDIKIEKNK